MATISSHQQPRLQRRVQPRGMGTGTVAVVWRRSAWGYVLAFALVLGARRAPADAGSDGRPD